MLLDTQQFSKKIGQNKGKPRIFLDGNRLVKAGWNKGDNYTIQTGNNSIVLTKVETGEKVVSGHYDKPVIDLLGGIISNTFSADTVRVNAVITPTTIIYTGV